MSTTTAASTGHLAMFQTVTAVLPRPMALPTACASGPVTTRESATSATSTTAIRVMTICSGRSFQNGRPSPIS